MKKIKKILIFLTVTLLVAVIIACAIMAKNAQKSPLTYVEYNNLSAEEQEEYFNSFENIDEFFKWYNQAKQAYEEEQERIEMDGNTDIDINIGEAGKDE